MLKYTLYPVKNYTGLVPTFEAGQILDPSTDIVSVPSSISHSVDVHQSSSAISQIGGISLDLHNNYGSFSIGGGAFANSGRDHRLVMSRTINGEDKFVWSGFVKTIQETGGAARTRVQFDHDLNRLDDIAIAGDESRPLITLDDLITEINARLPEYMQFSKRGDFATEMIHRPESNTRAREFMGNVLVAERLIGFYSTAADGWVIASADSLTESTSALRINTADIQQIRTYDQQQKMYNIIKYTPYGEDAAEVVYEGEDELYRPPASFIYEYGRRELTREFSHLDPDAAARRATAWQDATIKPRHRCEVLIDIPDHAETIGINHLVLLNADHRNGVQFSYGGWFRVVGLQINPAQDNVRLSLAQVIDIPEATLAALTPRLVG